MPRKCITDLRGPAGWSRADRTRATEGDRAIVSTLWQHNPFGISGAKVFPNVQPGVWRSNGIPVGTPYDFNAVWGSIVDQHPDWSLLEGKPMTIWASGSQSVTAVDLTRLDVIEEWTDLLLGYFYWADGVHFDYFSSLSWLDASISPAYWRSYDLAYAATMMRLKRLRVNWMLTGQQFHLTAITPYVDGLYLEESPGHFGLSFDQIKESMWRHGHPENWTIELRSPQSWSAEYRETVARFAASQGCFLSWGRDATAGVGFPA